MNPLEKEFKNIVKSNDEILNFIKDSNIDGIWYWDIENIEENKNGWHNAKFWQILGYTIKEIKEKNISIFDLCYDEDIIRAEINFKKHLSNPKKYPYNEDLRYTHKNGHTVWLNVKAIIIYNKENEPYRLLGVNKCITKEKNAALALKEKIQHYENVISGADMGSWEYNFKTNIVKYNERWANIFGYTLKELEPLAPKEWLKYVHPDDLELIDSGFENRPKGVLDSEIEFRMRHKKGHWVWVLSRGKVMLSDLKGNPQVLAGSHYDITERKRNEELLRYYKDLLERTNEVANIGSWDLDLIANTLDWSSSTRKIHGVDDNFDLTLESAISFYPEGSDREGMESNLNLAITENKTYDFELQIRTIQGELKWVRALGIPIHENGVCIRVFGLFQDIDERKKSEVSITLSEKKFRDTFTYAGSGIAILNTNLNVIQANPSFCNIFGYTEKELHVIDLKDLWHPEDSSLHLEELREVVLGTRDQFNEEKRHLHKDGSLLWISTVISSIKDDDGVITQYIVQVQDITPLKTNEILLTHYKNLLEQTNKVAKIGYWELNFVTNKHFWSTTTREIHGVDDSFKASLEDGLAFYPDGKNRDLIQKSVDLAMQEGKSYDVELQIKTTKGKLKWVRTIGVPVIENNTLIKMYGLLQDIDERKKIATDLATKEEEFRQTFTEATTGLALISLEGKVLKANKSLSESLGYTEEEIKNLSYKDITVKDDLPESTKLFNELLERKRDGYSIEKRYTHKQGHVFWVKVSYSSIKTTEGKLLHYLVQIEDITKRKLAQQQIIDYKNLLEKSNEVAKIGSWTLNTDTLKISWSESLIRIFSENIPKKSATNFSIYNYIQEKDQKHISEVFRAALINGENFDLEVQMQNELKEKFWVRLLCISEMDGDRCVKMYGLAQDIEEIKKTEQEVLLKEEEFRQTFTLATIGLVVINDEGKITKSNNGFCDLLGYTEEEICLKTFKDITYKDDIDKTKKLHEELLSGFRTEYKLEKRYVHKKGHVVWVSVTLSSIMNDAGELLHYLKQVENITELKKNQKQVIDYKNLLEHSNEVAKIGSWEIFQNAEQKVFLSNTLKYILKIPKEFTPTVEGAINLHPKGKHRNKITEALNKAINNGENFDVETQVRTHENNLIWVRIIGITEFKDNKCVRFYGLLQDIDEAKKLELEIAVREEQFRLTFTHAAIGMALINKKGTISLANPRLCEIIGYTQEEIQSSPIFNFSHPDDVSKAKTELIELIQGKRDVFKLEKRYIHKNGNVVWTKISSAAVKNDEGHFLHIVAQVQDITKTKQQQEQILDYKNLIERSNEVAKIGSWEVYQNAEQKVFLSDMLKHILKVPENYIPKIEDAVKFYPEGKNREKILIALDKAINNGENFDFETQIKTYENNLIWVRAVGITEFKNNKCTRLYGLFQDIDEAKKLELEIALREEQFRQTFWYANVGMALLDLNGKITKANPFVCEMFGYTEEEIKALTMQKASHPNDLDFSQQLMRELKEGNRDNFQLEKRYFHKNGEIIRVLLSTSAVKNDTGKISHLVAQIQDITENKRLTENLKEHNNRLLNFAHIVSHNLRSHTGNMTMLLQMNDEAKSNVIEDEIYGYIKSASNNMHETVNYLTEIVAINTNVKEKLKEINLHKSVLKALENVQSSINKNNIIVNDNIDESINVLVVPAYLDSIILNLITNAIKYRSENRPCNIEITSGITKKFIYLKVADNGRGIDLEKHGKKMFGMYKTFHEHEDARGVGLFISKNQAEAMGGRIEVESQVDKGSAFKVYFNYEEKDD